MHAPSVHARTHAHKSFSYQSLIFMLNICGGCISAPDTNFNHMICIFCVDWHICERHTQFLFHSTELVITKIIRQRINEIPNMTWWWIWIFLLLHTMVLLFLCLTRQGFLLLLCHEIISDVWIFDHSWPLLNSHNSELLFSLVFHT